MVNIYSTATYKELATFRSHKLAVTCVHVNLNYIATGSWDKTVRVHENREVYALVIGSVKYVLRTKIWCCQHRRTERVVLELYPHLCLQAIIWPE